MLTSQILTVLNVVELLVDSIELGFNHRLATDVILTANVINGHLRLELQKLTLQLIPARRRFPHGLLQRRKPGSLTRLRVTEQPFRQPADRTDKRNQEANQRLELNLYGH
ncbi:hypothetical protein NNT64_000889 [Salmonella enterica]|nr:hypothetical protein [Salmonella enterica]